MMLSTLAAGINCGYVKGLGLRKGSVSLLLFVASVPSV